MTEHTTNMPRNEDYIIEINLGDYVAVTGRTNYYGQHDNDEAVLQLSVGVRPEDIGCTNELAIVNGWSHPN